MTIETDGTLSPSTALSSAIEIMINQLKAIVGFKEEEPEILEKSVKTERGEVSKSAVDPEVLKTRVESLDISLRTKHALSVANIRTVGGLARKKEKDLLDIVGLGAKGIQEIKKALGEFGIITPTENSEGKVVRERLYCVRLRIPSLSKAKSKLPNPKPKNFVLIWKNSLLWARSKPRSEERRVGK